MALQNLRSSTAHKRPVATSLSDGQIAINTNAASPGIFFKNSSNVLTKVGPIFIGTSAPNSTPAGSAGNAVGEQWLDTSGGAYALKIWDGSAWQQTTVSGLTDANIAAGAAIQGTKIDPDFGSQTVETTGVFSAAGGAAATPSITFTGDLNTGIYSPGADQVAISTGGSGRLFVNSSGQVGIGTSPSYLLDLSTATGTTTVGDGTILRLVSSTTNGDANIRLGSGTNATARIGVNGTDFYAYVNGSERLRIDSSGRVGLGSSSPGEQLEVRGLDAAIQVLANRVGGTYSNSAITFGSPRSGTADGSTNSGRGLLSCLGNSASTSGIVWLQAASSSLDPQETDADLKANQCGIRLASDGSLEHWASNNARLVINSSGNVGIGTTSPSTGLEVATGSIFCSSGGLYLNELGGTSSTYLSYGGGNPILMNGANGALRFGTNNTERARIDSSGRLGLGTSTVGSSGNANLTIAGANNSGIQFGRTNATAGGGLITSASGPGMSFFHYSGAVGSETYTEGMRLTSTGLGIGTTAPQAVLHVEKNQASESGVFLNNSDASGYVALRLGNSDRGTNGDHLVYGGAVLGLRSKTGTSITFEPAGSEKVRIDSSGRVGIGTSSVDSALVIKGSTNVNTELLRFRDSDNTELGSVSTDSSGNTRMFLEDTSSNVKVLLHTAGNSYFTGGNVGIGTTSPGNQNSSASQLVVGNTSANNGITILTGTSNDGVLNFNDGDNTNLRGYLIYEHSTDSLRLGSAGSERARIDSSGRLLVGTSTISSGNGQIYVQQDANIRNSFAANNTASGTGSLGFIAFYRNGTFTGSISNTGSATAYNTSSDYRLKENVGPLTGAAARVQQLKPCNFNFIAEPDKTVDGFIAHEAQAVIPESVTGTKDAVDADGNPVYQGIDQSKLVPLLTAALQEALAKIETLEARLTAAGI